MDERKCGVTGIATDGQSTLRQGALYLNVIFVIVKSTYP